MSILANFFKRQNLAAICAILALTISGSSMSALSASQAPAPARRYSLMPFHSKDVPLEIREVRNLQTERFVRDLEIEVKNISSKPIYFIRLGLFFPEVKMSGKTYGIALYYGDLVNLDQLAGPDDTPLQPGATYVFKVPEPLWEGFEGYLTWSNLPAAAVSDINLRLDTISFGDGTGFEAGGDPYTSRKVNSQRRQ